MAQGYRTDDPAGATLDAALPRNGKSTRHFAALPHDEVAAAIETVRASGAYRATVLAFEFLVLTAARSGEVRLALWDEIAGDIWTVPASRAKTGRGHRVPLSDRALRVLAEARELSGVEGLIFPSVTGKALSDATLSKLIREQGIKAVPH